MKYEEARRLMKKEIVKHKNGTGPKNRWSLNRMNAIGGAVKSNGAQRELAKEFTSKRI